MEFKVSWKEETASFLMMMKLSSTYHFQTLGATVEVLKEKHARLVMLVKQFVEYETKIILGSLDTVSKETSNTFHTLYCGFQLELCFTK